MEDRLEFWIAELEKDNPDISYLMLQDDMKYWLKVIRGVKQHL